MSETAIHKDEGKPAVADVTYSLLMAIGMVLKRTQDSGKYPRYNWRAGGEVSRFAASAIRHIFKFMGGEDVDPESGLPHLWHAGCNVMFLIEWMEKGTAIDDRYKKTLGQDEVKQDPAVALALEKLREQSEFPGSPTLPCLMDPKEGQRWVDLETARTAMAKTNAEER